MIRRFMKGRLALGGIAVIGALALAAGAYAYFTASTTSQASSATAGNAASYTVSLAPTGSAVTLYPTAPGDANFGTLYQPYSGVVTNNDGGQQQVSTLTANIQSVTPASGMTCDTSNFNLYAIPGDGGWSVAGDGQSATDTGSTGTGTGTLTLPDDMAGGAQFSYNGIAVYMVDASSSQNGCQGAKVNVTVTAS